MRGPGNSPITRQVASIEALMQAQASESALAMVAGPVAPRSPSRHSPDGK
jgi:hypothetical protein